MIFDKFLKFDEAKHLLSTDQSFNQILADIDYSALQGLFQGGSCSPREIHQVSHVPKDQIEVLIFKTLPSFFPEGVMLWLKEHLPPSIFNWFFAVDFEKQLSIAHCKCLKKYIDAQIQILVHETKFIDGSGDLEFHDVIEKIPNNLSQENEKLNNTSILVVNLNARFDNLEKSIDKLIEIDRKQDRKIDQLIAKLEGVEFARAGGNFAAGQVVGIAGAARDEAGDVDDEDVGEARAEKERS